jgi:hypothetical protein
MNDHPEYANLSEQTKLEMEVGRKTAAANAAAMALAEQRRAAEAAPRCDVCFGPMPCPTHDEEAKAAADAAQPVAGLPPVEQRPPVFPLAKEPYQPKKPKVQAQE